MRESMPDLLTPFRCLWLRNPATPAPAVPSLSVCPCLCPPSRPAWHFTIPRPLPGP